MKTVILGLTGKRGCGKDTIASYLSEKHNFTLLTYTNDVSAPMLKKQGKPITRENLVELAMRLRKKHGTDILTRKICEKIKSRGFWAISGVRYPEEVQYFRNKFGNDFKLMAVECNSRIRYKRIKKRKTKGEAKLTYEQFLQGEKLPTEQVIPFTMQLAEFIIKNEGSFAELYEKIDKLIKGLII